MINNSNNIPSRNISYQLSVLKNNPKLRSRIEPMIKTAKRELRTYYQDVNDYNAELKRIEEENKRIDIENKRREEEYQRQLAEYKAQLKQAQEEQYRYEKRSRKRAFARTVTTTDYFNQSYLQAPKGYQGFSKIGEGETLQNIKTGKILPVYNVTGQEFAKRELLIKGGFIKPKDSPTRFIIPDKSFPVEKPTELKSIFQPTYFKKEFKESPDVIFERERKSDKPLSALITFKYREKYKSDPYVLDIPFYALREVQARIPKNSLLLKSPRVSYGLTKGLSRDVTAFSFFSPYIKTSTETIFTSAKYLKPKDMKIKDSLILIRPSKIKNVKAVESVSIVRLGNKPIGVGYAKQYVNKLNVGVGRTKTLYKNLGDSRIFESTTNTIVSKGLKLPSTKKTTDLLIKSISKPSSLKVSRKILGGRIARSFKPSKELFRDTVYASIKNKPIGTIVKNNIRLTGYKYKASTSPIQVIDTLTNYDPLGKVVATLKRTSYVPRKYNIKGLIITASKIKTNTINNKILSSSLTTRLTKPGTKLKLGKALRFARIDTNLIQNTALTSISKSSNNKIALGSVLKPLTTTLSRSFAKDTNAQALISLPSQKERLMLVPKLRTDLRSVSRSRTELITLEIEKSRSRQKTRQQSKQVSKLKQEQLLRLRSPQQSFKRPNLNLLNKSSISSIRIKPLIFFMPSMKGKPIKKTKSLKKFNFLSRYTPSLTGIIFKIYSRKKPRTLLKGSYGFNIRPLLK